VAGVLGLRSAEIIAMDKDEYLVWWDVELVSKYQMI